ncbi:LptE family protein [Paucihalobacter sp.]|uniref:LptE family protein n=1 Tax=Paucihalobacter sp. TaxID=2850405 RepID=UPI002FE1C0FE
MKTYQIICFLIACTLFQNCGFYSFTGADTGTAESFQVNFFQNNAPLIEPGLDIDFTNALQDLIQNQTKLSLVNSGGDLIYEGEIVEYRISPTTAIAGDRAAQNRLTITVQVRFFNNTKEEANFDQRFSFFFDYEGAEQLIGSQKDTAVAEIFERITQDIFNASLANW